MNSTSFDSSNYRISNCLNSPVYFSVCNQPNFRLARYTSLVMAFLSHFPPTFFWTNLIVILELILTVFYWYFYINAFAQDSKPYFLFLSVIHVRKLLSKLSFSKLFLIFDGNVFTTINIIIANLKVINMSPF